MARIGTEIVITMERRPCFVGEKKAWFHRWIDKDTPMLKVNAFLTQKAIDRLAEKIWNGIITAESSGEIMLHKCTLGLVEYEDGTVAEVYPTNIRFDVELEKEL